MSQHKDKTDAMNAFKKSFHDFRRHIAANCPLAEKLVSFADHDLAGDELRALKEHVDLCPVCLDALQKLQSARTTTQDSESPAPNWPAVEAEMDARVYSYLDTLATSKSPTDTVETGTSLLSRIKTFVGKLRLPPAPAYAGLAMVVLLVSLYGYAFFSRPATFAVAQIQLLPATQLRGVPEQADSFQQGLANFHEEHFQRAIENFTGYLQESPDHYLANFYLGVSYLASAKVKLLGLASKFDSRKVEKGIDYLQRALNLAEGNAFYTEDCLWYLGKAYLMLGRVNQAQQHFQRLLALPQPDLTRKSQTHQILQQMSHFGAVKP
ncbi:MAG: tol-pal system YbgF family protein [bacterium]